MAACPYKDIFGAPGTGVHSVRVAGIAVVDVVLTLLMAAIASWTFKTPLLQTTVACFLLGIACHRVFCANTAVDIWLFGRRAPADS